MLLPDNTDLNGQTFLRNDRSVLVFFAYSDDDEFKPSMIAIQWLYRITADSASVP